MATDLIGPILKTYTAEAVRALNPKPTRVIEVAPGASVAWDDCCGGQVWTRVVQVVPAVGRAGSTQAPCGVLYWVATVALGVVRCAHSLRDDGTAPPAHLISEDGQDMLDDLAALQEVVVCHPRTASITGWTPLGPQGGCHGGEWVFTVRFDVCGCPEATPHG
jgi:hypothetical protein